MYFKVGAAKTDFAALWFEKISLFREVHTISFHTHIHLMYYRICLLYQQVRYRPFLFL